MSFNKINKIYQLDRGLFQENFDNALVIIESFKTNINCIPVFWNYLSFKEKIHANRFYFSEDRDKYIISRGILRVLLAYFTKQSPQNIIFIYNKYGKPSLKDSNIKFNMSHSKELVSYIISFKHNVGIDIEYHHTNHDLLEIAEQVFTHKELSILHKLVGNERINFFYNIWTIKESLIKAIGLGMSYPVKTIEIICSSKNNIVLLNTEDKGESFWYFFSIEDIFDYSCALAIESDLSQILYIPVQQKNFLEKIN